VTDTTQSPAVLAAFRGRVAGRRTGNALILSGAAADTTGGVLILTFIGPTLAEFPAVVTDATVLALGECRYRITAGSREWIAGATSVHLHRDIGEAFYRAIPPRRVPLAKRLFWRGVLALAGTRAGKRLLLSRRRQT